MGNSKEKNPCMKWEVICKPEEEVGFGVKNLKNFNWTLLVKWKWRLLNDEKTL